MAVVAAASSNIAKVCSLGFSIGHVISERLTIIILSQREKIKESLKKAEAALADGSTTAFSNALVSETAVDVLKLLEQRDWLTPFASFIGNSVGLLISYTLQHAALTFSACSMGSEMMIAAMEELFDPYLKQYDLPTIKGNSEAVACLQASLVTLGFYTYLRSPSHPHGILYTLLYPMFAVEYGVNAAFMVALKK
jgi:hypothetical protein